MKNKFRFLFLGDIFGKPGRRSLLNNLRDIQKEMNVDFTVANGENLAHGNGINEKGFYEVLEAGVDVVTSGNHLFGVKQVLKIIDETDQLLIPANYPKGVPGQRVGIYEVAKGLKTMIINLHGRVLINTEFDCPFRTLEDLLAKYGDFEGPIWIDFHAEATSEKRAMGLYFDGKISGIFGTHTHIQTSDERIMPNGTAYITDLGMCGPYDSVIGITLKSVIKNFLYSTPSRFEVASSQPSIQGIAVDYSVKDAKAVHIERVFRQY